MTKNKKIFFSYSFTNRDDHRQDYQKLKSFLEEHAFICYSFVFDFKDKLDNRRLMDEALSRIEDSDILVADPHFGSFGIGLEAGYAKAKKKTIIYFHHHSVSTEATLEGIADFFVDYNSVDDLIDWFDKNIDQLN